MLPLGLMPMCVCNNDHSDVFVPFTLSIPREPEPQGVIKRVAQGSNFVFEGSNRTTLDLRGLSTDF